MGDKKKSKKSVLDKLIYFVKINIFLIIITFLISFTCFIFGKGLIYLSDEAFKLFPYNLLFLPLVGIGIVYFKNLKQDELDGSMKKVFHATKDSLQLSYFIVPFQILATWASHFTGASVGREGVALQLGATISNQFASSLKLDSKLLTSAGKAAGFSALFGTPLAGIFFSIQMNNKSIKDYKFLYAATFMSFLGSYLTSLMGLSHFHKNIEVTLHFNILILIKIIIIGLIIIAVGNLFVITLNYFKNKFSKIFKNEYIKIIILSIIYILIMYVLSGRYMSLGTNLINMSFDNPSLILYQDFILKLLLTTYIISIGFQGGEVTPLFSIGATLGVVLANIFNLPVALVSALGYSYVFGSATNAVFASFFICIEVFGLAMTPYALIVFIICYLLKNNKSIYPDLSKVE